MAFRLQQKCQTYAWGKDAESSLVAKYIKECDKDFIIVPAVNYAEVCDVARVLRLLIAARQLWMGTHPKGPASLSVDGTSVSLAAWIEANPSSLGDRVLKRWGPQLPFLFKVLSIRTALSIQV